MYKEGFSIITVTNRSYCIKNLIQNYINQNFKSKELIIVINSNLVSIEAFKIYEQIPNIKLFKLDESISLGQCLNFAISKSIYSHIAKFDDDDYYGPNYLNEVYNTFLSINCDIVGKNKTYYYFEKFRRLMIKKNGIENDFSPYIMGSTICFKKDIFNNVKFKNISSREDYYFNKDCIKNGYKIFASSSYNHIVFKHSDNNKHTFLSNMDILIDRCEIVLSNISLSDCFKIVDFK
ncbi:hypothetical protein SDC9_164370 [bioreactor metagenome]|uniref:Glycosyl transferase family 2 n=2 Tax=root TaxID=1 RepID=A0A1G9KDA8_9FIRM|nr:glycosyltransferase [Romboutsia lituseburensis]CEH34856.1 Glycosyltransferase [Romboutsia lituseburensis]SDL47414.1 Glycosyl transferase family 2 [Romboutsia lituseburensis DSM 797]